MGSYKIVISPTALKDLKALPKDVIKSVSRHIDSLSKNPRPPHSKKLQGYDFAFRLRVKQVYRVLYKVFDQEKIVHILRVLHRKDAYRNLEL